MCWHSFPAWVEGHTCIHFRLLTRSWCWQVADKIKWAFEASKWQWLAQVVCNELGTEWQTTHTSSGVRHCRLTLFENQGSFYVVFLVSLLVLILSLRCSFQTWQNHVLEKIWSSHLLRSVHIRRTAESEERYGLSTLYKQHVRSQRVAWFTINHDGTYHIIYMFQS